MSRLAHRYPFLYADVASGKRSLTALSRLAPFVVDANAHLLFSESANKSVREVERILAVRFPKEATPDRWQRTTTPLGGDKTQLSFTVGPQVEEKLREARALLSHRLPGGKLADVFELALDALLTELEKPLRAPRRRPAQSTEVQVSASSHPMPRPNAPAHIAASPAKLTFSKVPRPSRYIPRGMKAFVWQRDGGRCGFKRPDGSLCGATHFLEIDHRWPFALGGRHSEANLRLLCRTHNRLAALEMGVLRLPSPFPA